MLHHEGMVGGTDAIEGRVRSLLNALGVDHTAVPCDPELADTAAFCSHYGYPLESSANTIVVAARREPDAVCACVVLATMRLDVNHTVCDLLGVRKASFASAEQTQAITGMLIGGVTPFGLPGHVPLYIDAHVMEREWVIVGGGSRSMKLRIRPDALLRITGARVIKGLAGGVAS